MILHHTASDTLGHWHMGTAELLLDAGHDEYMLDLTADLIDRYTVDEEEPDLPKDQALADRITAMELDGWEVVYHVHAPVIEIARAFYRLSLDLDPSMDPTNYTPGGDDDTFDYWPSGMRLLHALAVDLDELTRLPEASPRSGNPSGDRYIERYRQVLGEAIDRDVPEMDDLPEYEKVSRVARRWIGRDRIRPMVDLLTARFKESSPDY